MKPYAESCDQNREPILRVIRLLFEDCKEVLEIGSGTGQHAVFFAEQMPHLLWRTSDRAENHAGIKQWLAEAGLGNTVEPVSLDVTVDGWPEGPVDAVFSANAVHIMSWPAVEKLFSGVSGLLQAGGLLVLYGPFNYQGAYTSESNARFDVWLKERDPVSGIRDFEALNELAEDAGMALQEDYEMPANNRILCWRKRG